jgi:hypothetical protein
MTLRDRLGLLATALLHTLAATARPLHTDEPFTVYTARQILAAPCDPYGFEIFWWQWPQPAHEDLLNPVVAYWTAGGMALFGDDPLLWKLWLLPFALLFAWAFLALARRFAPGLAWPLLLATAFGPALLPSLNLMQDVPALALGLAALALYLRAADAGSAPGAIAAGVLAGVAVQTKYTALALVGAIAVHAVLWRRPRPGALAVGAALAVFAAWELAMTLRYGEGMLVGTWNLPQTFAPRADLPPALVPLAGATLPGVGLLGLGVAGLGTRSLHALALALLAGFALLLWGPWHAPLWLGAGLLVWAGLAGATWRLLREGPTDSLARWIEARRVPLFFALWIAGELVQYVLVSPFPAVRRVLALDVAATLLVGHAASRSPWRGRLPLASLVGLQVLLGLVVHGVDVLEARAGRTAAREAASWIRAQEPGARIWFVGHWGFQFHAEQAGLEPLIPDYTQVRRGDWLVVPSRVDHQAVRLDPEAFEERRSIAVGDGIPLATLKYGFYVGARPLQHHRGPRMRARLFRAERDNVPQTAWGLAELTAWARHAGGRQASWATRALARELEARAEAPARTEAALALAALGPGAAEAAPALERVAAGDPDARVRAAACAALARVSPQTSRPAACTGAPP